MVQPELSMIVYRRMRAGVLLVTVTIPLWGCAGGGSSLTPPPTNPQPAITALSPTSVTAGTNGTTVTITGSGFIATSGAQRNNGSRTTTFVSSTDVEVALTTADIAAGATGQITVANDAHGGAQDAGL